MEPVRLQTREGEFVAEVRIPPFALLPEVLIWGSRVFCRVGEAERGAHEGALVYREGFAFWVPPEA
jgi:hypothetical protein